MKKNTHFICIVNKNLVTQILKAHTIKKILLRIENMLISQSLVNLK